MLGGLSYHEFAKYALVGSPLDRKDRAAAYGQMAPKGTRLAGYLDCGEMNANPTGPIKLTLNEGRPYNFGTDGGAPQCFGTVFFDDKAVTLEAAGLNPKKAYLLGFSWWDHNAIRRVETVSVTGADGEQRILLGKCALPDYKVSKKLPELRGLPVPAGAYADGKLKISFANETPGANAVVSEIWLWEAMGKTKPLEVWGPIASNALNSDKADKTIAVDLYATDPVGRLVDAAGVYLPDDKYYVDFTTANPFEALEQYGLSVRAAQNAKPHLYDFPTVCGWYVMIKGYGGGPDINNSAGMVDEMEQIKKTGFLKYSKAAVRLVPDTYADNNEQGWWDEAHWQKYTSGGSPYTHYRAPYETTAKWAGAVNRLGGLAFTYVQTGFLSVDYAKAFSQSHAVQRHQQGRVAQVQPPGRTAQHWGLLVRLHRPGLPQTHPGVVGQSAPGRRGRRDV